MTSVSEQIISYPTQNFDERKGDVKALIIHYTGTLDTQSALDRYLEHNPSDGVGRISPHYVISEAGEMFSLVSEDKRAWHAGASKWHDWEDLNSLTIGIELINKGDVPFAEPQIRALVALSHGIVARHNIAPQNILGHSDIAPGRKTDPGWFFPWQRFAQEGLGVMPQVGEGDLDIETFRNILHAYGYRNDVADDVLIAAFQMHFCQSEQAQAGKLTPRTVAAALGLLKLISA